MTDERYDSEKSTVQKLNADVKYNACCISCGSTKDIELWPHRNGHGHMVGFIFACSGCQGIVKGIRLLIEGVRVHERRFVDLTPAECELLIHGLQLADEQGSTNREEWPLIEPLLEKLGYGDMPLAEGEAE